MSCAGPGEYVWREESETRAYLLNPVVQDGDDVGPIWAPHACQGAQEASVAEGLEAIGFPLVCCEVLQEEAEGVAS